MAGFVRAKDAWEVIEKELNMAGVHGIPTGVQRYFKDKCYDGYNLVPVYSSTDTYLLNMEGEIVHTWKSDYLPGLFAHLMPDGTLVRGIRLLDAAVRFAGTTGGFERLDWEGNVLQRYIKNDLDKNECLSHAFCPMPNGNTMVICLENKSAEEAYAKGRVRGTLPERGMMINGRKHNGIYLDYLMEIDRDNNVVWEWHLWDHVGEGEDQFDLNYRLPKPFGYYSTCDWVHFNAVDYNPDTDQVVVCCRNFGEFAIIDRKSGKIVFRWGNPCTHGMGRAPSYCDDGDEQLFGPHNAHFLPNGNVQVFDNGCQRPQGNRSRVLEVDVKTGEIAWEYRAHNPFSFCSPFQSASQRLPNGNVLVTASGTGQIFEVTAGAEPMVCWEFVCPWLNDGTVTNYLDDRDAFVDESTGIQKGFMRNMIHRVYRYGKEYPAFAGRDLSGAVPIDPSIGRLWEIEPFKSGLARAAALPWPKEGRYFKAEEE